MDKERIIKTDKEIPKFTLDFYPDKPLFKAETNIYNTEGADAMGNLGRESPMAAARSSRPQVSYKRGK